MPGARSFRLTKPILLGFLACATIGCQRFRARANLEDLARSRDLLLAGQVHLEEERLDEAEKRIRDAVKACPEDERAYEKLAEVLSRKQQWPKAIDAQRRCVEISPDQPRHRIRLGEMLLEAGNANAAMEQVDVALKADRSSATAWNLRARILEATDRQGEALACWHRSLAIAPEQQDVHVRIATIYERQGRPSRALATWQSLEALFPGEQIPDYVYLRQALALRELERRREAVDRLLIAQRLNPESPEISLALADLQWSMGDRQNARLTLAQASRRWPGHPQVLRLASSWNQWTPPRSSELR